MTRAQVLAVIELAVPFLAAGGHQVLYVTGLDNNVASLLVGSPLGPLPVEFTLPESWLADGPGVDVIETHIRHALRPFEGEAGRGFNDAGRGALAVGSTGYSANDGWV